MQRKSVIQWPREVCHVARVLQILDPAGVRGGKNHNFLKNKFWFFGFFGFLWFFMVFMV
jgi:hypothetical protein